jgi:hypothetical protein
MSYTKIETSTKDAKTKKALTLGELANANSTTWKAIDAKTLTGWCDTIQAANNTFSGLDEVWENNREALSKQFQGDRPKSQFAKYYSGYTGSISNMNHFLTIARGKKTDGKYTGKLFTTTDVKKYWAAIKAANEAGKPLKYSRLINLASWFHSGADMDACTKESPTLKPTGEGEEESGKKSGSNRLSIVANGKGHLKETSEGELNKSLPKDGSLLSLCSDAFSVMFKAMEREEKDAFDMFKAQVVAKCGPLVLTEAEVE